MKSKTPLTHFLLALACSFSGVLAEDAPAPAAAAPLPGGGAQVQPKAAAPDPIKQPAAKKDPRPGWLGFVLDTAIAVEGADPKEKKEEGVGVLSVVEDSPAEKAGLKEGDRVLSFGGKKAQDHAQLRELIREAQPEQAVLIMVRRAGKEVELKAKLGAAPEAVPPVQIVDGFGGIGVAQLRREAVPGIVTFRSESTISSFSTVRNPPTPPNEKDTVKLRDGNVFTGEIRGITAEKGVQLQREGLPALELIQEEITSLSFADPKTTTKTDAPKAGAHLPKVVLQMLQREGVPALELIQEEIRSLTFADPKTTTKTDAPKAAAQLPKVVLQMRDGSIFHGDALTMENGKLLLTLPAGPGETEGKRVAIPREHAQLASISENDAPRFYDGPTGLTGWSSGRYSNSQWEYKDGFLRCAATGSIGRDLGLMPDPVDLSFDVNYPPQAQHFNLLIFSPEVSRSGVGALSVRFTAPLISATHYDGQRTNQYRTNPPPDGQLNAGINISEKSETIRYRLLVDRVKGRVLIYKNGEKRADWQLSSVKPEDLAKCGGAFSITPSVSIPGTMFEIGRVRVMPWDGKEPQQEIEHAEAKGDQLISGDGKVAAGTIERITEGEVVFANPGTKMRREKTLFIRFAPPAGAEELAPATVAAQLKNGSQISATQVTSKNDMLTLKTRCGPEVTVPLAALRELNFLPRPGQAEVAVKNLDVLTLTDGTQFTGRAMLPPAEQGLKWKIAASKMPLEFPTAKVAGLVFRSTEGERQSTPLKGDSALRLANGDWLQGEVVSLDGEQLVLKTDLAPALKCPLSELREVYLNSGVVGTLADGATGPESWADGWSPGRGANLVPNPGLTAGSTAAKSGRAWTYHDGGYKLAATGNNQRVLARKWPAYEGASAIHFEVASPMERRSFSAQIYNSKEERTFSISFSYTRIYVYYHSSSAPGNRIGAPKNLRLDNKSGTESGKVRVTLVMDRPAKTFRILVDGKEVGKIAFNGDDAKEALDAGGLSLSLSGSGLSTRGIEPARVGNIWLAPWNGTPAVAAEQDKPAADPEPDAGAEKTDALKIAAHVFLANGDEFTGTIESLTPDLVTVNSEAGPLELPGKRVARLRFPGTERPPTDHFPRLRFHDRGLLSVNDLQITGDRVKCQTLDGQSLDFPLSVVKEAVWRPLDAK